MHKVHEDKAGATLTNMPLTHLAASAPSDLLIGSMLDTKGLPLLTLKLTFRPPRVGSKVVCVGYTAAPHVDQRNEYFNYSFSVVEGTVIAIFPKGLGRVLPAACFLIDVEPPHGMSGGPVFDEHGNVCGIVSMGATQYMPIGNGEYPAEAGVVSLLHPLLPTSLGMNGLEPSDHQAFFDWIAKGYINTDGSELMCDYYPKGDGHLVGGRYESSMRSAMYAGLQDFLDGKLFSASDQ